MDPIILTKLGTTLGTAAVQQVAKGAARSILAQRRWPKAVGKRAAHVVGEPWLAGPIASWLRDRKHVWPLIEHAIEDGDQSHLVTGLAAVLAERRRAMSGDDIQRMASTCVDVVMGNIRVDLQPSWAIHIDSLWTKGELKRLREELNQDKDVLSRRALLPPLARQALDQLFAVSPDTAAELLAALVGTSTSPAAALAALTTEPLPPYLDTGPALAWTVIGEVAAGHLDIAASAAAFERAALGGAHPRHLWMGRAALAAIDLGERERAVRLAELAQSWSPSEDRFVEVIQRRIEGNWAGVAARAASIAGHGDEDRFVELLAIQADLATDRIDEGAARLRALRARDPEMTGLAVALARVLIQTALRGHGHIRTRILREAIAIAVTARDLRRSWRGPSYQAVSVACDAHLALREVDAALRLATPPPTGEASAEEAAAPELRALAASIALSRGDRTFAEACSTLADEYYRLSVAAQLAAYDGASRDEVVRSLQGVLEAAGNDPVRRLATMKDLALVGHWPIEGPETLPGVTPVFIDWLHAIAASFSGDQQGAIQLARQHRHESEDAAVILAEAYARSDQIDAAVDELKEAAVRFESPQRLADAAKLLWRRGRRSEAEDVALQAIGLLPDDSVDRRDLRRLLIDASGLRRDLQGIIDHAHALLLDDPDDIRVRWALVTALGQQVDLDAAWAVLRERPLDPSSEQEALIWLSLQHRFADPVTWIERALELVVQHIASPDVCATFIFITRSVAPTSVSAEISDSIRRSLQTIIDLHPNNEYFAVIQTADDATFAEELRKMLARRALVYDTVAEQVDRGRLPVGMLVVALGGTYTESLLYGLARPFRTHASRMDALDAAAIGSLPPDGGEVVVDLSALTTASLVPELWPTITATFRRVRGAHAALVDLLSGVDAMKDRTLTAQLDPSTGNPVIADASAAMSTLQVRVRWMWSVRETVKWSEIIDPTRFATDPADERWTSWMSSVQLAQECGVPLLCDDVALRDVARQRGVVTFPVSQVLRRLRDSGDLPPLADMSSVARIIAAR